MRWELKRRFLPQVVHKSSSLSVEDSTVSPDADKLDKIIESEFDTWKLWWDAGLSAVLAAANTRLLLLDDVETVEWLAVRFYHPAKVDPLTIWKQNITFIKASSYTSAYDVQRFYSTNTKTQEKPLKGYFKNVSVKIKERGVKKGLFVERYFNWAWKSCINEAISSFLSVGHLLLG